ncbi:MAG: hypothetical protein K9G62_01285 [Alphaproteobacteria bacterium]|nr:hypothetical protein [Alphaproteobacteria bacterium]
MAQKLQNRNQSSSHSIALVTAEMGVAGSPIYHYIVFRDHTGTNRMEMHGLPVARGPGSGVRALRGVMAPASSAGLPSSHFKTISDAILFRGPVREYLRKMACAVDALNFINNQNLNYRSFDESGDGPNSIAHTLVQAMELEFPVGAAYFWAPGRERILLPRNWRSPYA